MHTITVTKPNDPRISKFSWQRDLELRKSSEIIIDSALVVTRFLKSSFKLKQLLATRLFYQKHQSLLAKHLDATFFCAEHSFMEAIVGHRLHQGVIAIGERPPDTDLSELDSPIVVLAGVNNSENVGAIIRNCHAFGIKSLLVDALSCSPWVRRAIRVSVGSVFKLKIYHSSDVKQDFSYLKEQGYQIYATGNVKNSIDLDKTTFHPKTALIFGQEGDGIAKDLISLSDNIVRIPVAANIDSLNVAVASGITLYHLKTKPCLKAP